MEKTNSPKQLFKEQEKEQSSNFDIHPFEKATSMAASMPPPPFQLKNSGEEEEDEPIQKMSKGASNEVQENNTGLPDDLKSGIEGLSGLAMDDVQVHFNSSKPAQLQAHAYAQGTDIHVAPGQEQHLAHEAWHVVQQKQGRVKPTTQLRAKVAINDDQGLETEADVMGAKAMQFKPSLDKSNALQLKSSNELSMDVAQCIKTRPRSVAMDMHHDEWNTIFDDVADFAYLWEGNRANWNRNGRIARIIRHIDDADKDYSYSQLSDDTLDSAADLIALYDDEADEKMYVHNGNNIHTAARNADVKKPHPTLVGGDPDVTCAGTLNIVKVEADDQTTYTVSITTDSGHFRPANVPGTTLTAIRDAATTDVPDNTTINVGRA